MKKSLLHLFAFCLILLASAQGLAQTEPPPDLDDYVARALKEFEVPGLAVAIVKDGKVEFVKGYGVRKLGEPAPVDEQTLFGIASNTKAFTAAALAILVDEGKISWDDPVIKHLPGFQMYDPFVTREMTVRDLLTHRSGLGLGAGDLMFFPPTTFTRDEIVARLRYIKPATSFRSKYAYDNVLYLVAGQVVAAVSGKSWDDFIKERIFAPLGMTASNTSVKDLRPVPGFSFIGD
jgi:CubicO group peptidase (beta-lactamase class C family)